MKTICIERALALLEEVPSDSRKEYEQKIIMIKEAREELNEIKKYEVFVLTNTLYEEKTFRFSDETASIILSAAKPSKEAEPFFNRRQQKQIPFIEYEDAARFLYWSHCMKIELNESNIQVNIDKWLDEIPSKGE